MRQRPLDDAVKKGVIGGGTAEVPDALDNYQRPDSHADDRHSGPLFFVRPQGSSNQDNEKDLVSH